MKENVFDVIIPSEFGKPVSLGLKRTFLEGAKVYTHIAVREVPTSVRDSEEYFLRLSEAVDDVVSNAEGYVCIVCGGRLADVVITTVTALKKVDPSRILLLLWDPKIKKYIPYTVHGERVDIKYVDIDGFEFESEESDSERRAWTVYNRK